MTATFATPVAVETRRPSHCRTFGLLRVPITDDNFPDSLNINSFFFLFLNILPIVERPHNCLISAAPVSSYTQIPHANIPVFSTKVQD